MTDKVSKYGINKIFTYKKTVYLVFVFFAIIFTCCANNTNRVYFTINPENRQINIPVQLNDSITANMVFDTGWYNRAIFLDSTFVASHPILTPDVRPDTSQVGSSWTNYKVLNLAYNTPITVKIGNALLRYNEIQILNWKEAMHSDNDGIFNIPVADTAHVWELNFEHNYLEIHPAGNFKMPENSFVCPLETETHALFAIQLNMPIRSLDGDTLTINGECTVDIGMACDFALMHPTEKESDFLNKREDAVWTEYLDGYERYYTVNATIFDNCMVDSLRIYTFSNPYSVGSKYLIGQNFLKRFNVFFDMKNSQIGLQPIKNFQRIVNPNHRRFHFSTKSTPKGNLVVTMMADYKGNYYKTAGLQNGDEIVAINGKLFKNITYEEKLKFHEVDTLLLDIVRNRQALKIVVPVDKNEKQGD